MPNSEYTTDQIAIISSNLRTVSDETYPSKTAIAADYNATAAYNVGDYCLRNSLFYKCNTAISSSGEAWNSGHWDAVDVGSELKAGVPSGGDVGNILVKSSATDYATEWINFDNLFIVQSFAGPIVATVASNEFYNQDITVSYNGYEAIGIMGYDFTGTNISLLHPYQCYLIDATTARFRARNQGGSNATNVQCVLYVLFKKSFSS